MTQDPQAQIRAFIAAQLPAPVREAVANVQRDLKSTIHSKAIRWSPPEQIHLTLRFLGNIAAGSVPDVERAVRRACQNAAPFELCAEGLGAFPDEARPRVIWIGLSGQLDLLRRLHAEVSRETEAWGEREEKGFHPHLTLARVKDAPPAALREIAQVLLRKRGLCCGSWRLEQLELMRSELSPSSARHSALASVSFLPG